jgi:outer membrane receptor protein involved in Fe transport
LSRFILPKFVEVGVRFGADENTGGVQRVERFQPEPAIHAFPNARFLMMDASYVVAQRSRRFPQRAGVVCSEFVNRGAVSYLTGGSAWTSETRFGYNRTIQDRLDRFFTLIDPKQSTEAIAFGRRLPDIGTSLGWSGPSGEINHSGGPLWQIGEKYARVIGHHSLKFGGDYHRSIGTRNNPQIPDFFYSSFSALLANEPSQVTATLGSGLYSGRMYELGFFVQDDWRVASKLAINLGMRYDFYSNFEAHGEDGTPDAGLYNPNFLSMDGKFSVGPFRSRSSPYENDAKNFGPRVGFSYNPDGKGKTQFAAGSA